MYDLLIVGGGPAGVAAGVYAARKRLKTHLVTFDWGGQSVVSTGIQNWIGFIEISGQDLANKLKEHLFAYKGDIVDITESDKVARIEKTNEGFLATLESGKTIAAKTVLAAAGSQRRKLEIKGADVYEHKGLTYCASCDGPMFTDQDVVVVGGGNSAFESAAQLLAYAKSVTLIQRGNEFRADPTTVEKLLAHPRMRAIKNAEMLEVHGEQFVTGFEYKDRKTGDSELIPCSGVFVEIGHIPTTEYLDGLVSLNDSKHIITDPRTQKTSCAGVWAAGDCTDGLYYQIGIASGDAIRALEDIYIELKSK